MKFIGVVAPNLSRLSIVQIQMSKIITAKLQQELVDYLTFPEFFYYMDEMHNSELCTAPFKLIARDILRLEKRLEALENGNSDKGAT